MVVYVFNCKCAYKCKYASLATYVAKVGTYLSKNKHGHITWYIISLGVTHLKSSYSLRQIDTQVGGWV